MENKIRTVLLEFENAHSFKPHITLARIKSLHDKPSFNKISQAKTKFDVNAIKLYKSTLTLKEPVSEILEEYKAQPAKKH